jgi:hypothetical protein
MELNNYVINLAKSPDTSPEVLNELSRHEHWEIRTRVALNKNTSVETLIELSKEKNVMVISAVASNPKTPQSILKKFECCRSSDVRLWAMKNPSATEETIILAKATRFIIELTEKKL